MKHIISILLNPLIIFWGIVIVAVCLRYFNKTQWARVTWLFAGIWIFVVSASPVPRWMAGQLERRNPVFNIEDHVLERPVYIVVLGGGHVADPRLPALGQLSESALARLTEGVRLYHSIEASKIVLSGYSRVTQTVQADVTAKAALELNVSAEDTLLLRTPHNTRAEAEAFARKIGSEGTVILVTSAIHMPRALRYFRAKGLNMLSAPCGYLARKDPHNRPLLFWPSYHNIHMFDRAMHEYPGLLGL